MGFGSHAILFSIFPIFSSFCLDFIIALDTITKSQPIKDPETISSIDNVFQLGFFSPGNSTNRYVGVWYLSKSNVIWVANREQPLRDSSGIVTISEDSNLVVMDGKKQVVWSSNVSNLASNSSAKLLDTGNLVLLDDSTGNTLWESFQHPTDSFVPKMKLSTNEITGKKVQMTSWKSPSDPSTGNFSYSIERLSVPETFIWNKTKPYFRTGPWNGRVYLGMPKMKARYLHGTSYERDENGTVYSTFSLQDEVTNFAIFVLDSQGNFVEKNWQNKKEAATSTFSATGCDIYGFCGSFGTCNAQSSPLCSCLKGFKPNNTEEWSKQNWKSGCVRSVPLHCEMMKNGGAAGEDDGFLNLETSKLPDFAEQSSISEDTCRTQCLQNCSCIAYAYDGGIGCMSWSGNLIDIQRFTEGGADIYIKVASSELDKKRSMTLITAVAIAVGILAIAVTCSYFLWKWTFIHSPGRINTEHHIRRMIANTKYDKLEDLPLYDFRKVVSATNNFHSTNLIGRGGFGPVYKGELQDGQKIAVKRCSRTSGQGLEEFINEVVVIAKLQHRNLVRLLGYCIKGDEKMLIYEYMSNKSLDAHLFDQLQCNSLDWEKRINIIKGVARGLLYLHRDSRLKIIHRDLKASNILLDKEMNPKISDFGTARIFKGNEEEGNTKKVVGTYGYMSPEYAMKGSFSEKSDIYSFGVLLLEIVSRKRNTSFYKNKHSLTLIEFAWKLWNEESIKTLIDPEISDPRFENQILRCIHIGLLCVQELASNRPSMTIVVSMLNSEIVNLPPPGQVAFAQKRNLLSSENCQEEPGVNSANSVTLSEIQGR